jgi:hypothetical protein
MGENEGAAALASKRTFLLPVDNSKVRAICFEGSPLHPLFANWLLLFLKRRVLFCM